MPEILRLPRIETKPKRIEFSPHFDRASYFKGKPQLLEFFLDIVDAVKSGAPLPPWSYRRDIDVTDDAILLRLGILHLHLGSQSSNELLFLEQYDDHVVLLEISNHRHFKTDPPGTLLHRLHRAKVDELNAILQVEREREAEEAASAKESKTLRKVEAIRKSLGLKRKDPE